MDYTVFVDLAKELDLDANTLRGRVQRAFVLFKNGHIKYDAKELVHKKSIFIEKYNRKQMTAFVYNKDKKKFFEAINWTSDNRYKIIKKRYTPIWSKDAKYCYDIKCKCSKCSIANGYPVLLKECRMKKHVLELVRLHGVP